MTTMHQPATPLPWASHVNAIQLSAESSGPKLVRFIADERISNDRSVQDAAYIAHAANAYPKLVAVLRFYATQPMGGEASKLLRELEESE